MQLVDLFVAEEEFVRHALAAAREQLVAAVDVASATLQNGGRLFYVGAGTSGRLGVLDASEIPPTFGTPLTWCKASWPADRLPCTQPSKARRTRRKRVRLPWRSEV